MDTPENRDSINIISRPGGYEGRKVYNMFRPAPRKPVYDLHDYDYIADNPHTLIGGSTGCGKSVLIDTLIYSALTDTRRGGSPIFYLIDPKRVSLNKYRKMPNVQMYGCEYDEAQAILSEIVRQMEYRYKIMQGRSETLIRAVDIYCVIDELADLLTMPESKKEIKPLIQRITQLGRAARVHMIAATQCPARKIIPAELTLNFTEKIALRCDTAIESRQLIGIPKAETIREYGTCYMRSKGEVYRLNVPMIAPNDIDQAIRHYTQQAPIRAI